eukprot:TRINITY_DN8566_c0_g1_i1.p1 TRINITY_DN8566_c0_g1~~TRINITY_DN8566_c0_g1_i1.p1  ORF type:complete len:101 (+),score=16.31 TRINITY_DN8566_c0_g1_i1:292-594(+)
MRPSVLSRVLGSYALSIAGVRAVWVVRPTSKEALWGVLWTFLVFESMFAIEVGLYGLEFKTVAFGVVAGTISVIILLVYNLNGWLDPLKQSSNISKLHVS